MNIQGGMAETCFFRLMRNSDEVMFQSRILIQNRKFNHVPDCQKSTAKVGLLSLLNSSSALLGNYPTMLTADHVSHDHD